MGSMTDERRKEMEEEMMRFELEIAAPGEESPAKKVKPLPPPPPPPPLVKLNDTQPEAKKPKLAPPPPPPTPPIVEILPTDFVERTAIMNTRCFVGSFKVLKPPPPPPPPPSADPNKLLLPPPMPSMQPPRIGNMQFIPHQVRQASRPPRPPTMMPMRGPPGFHGPGPMHFPPMQNSLPPPPQMPMPLPPMGLHMPMPPTFCPPPPGIGIGPMPPPSFVSSAPIAYVEPLAPASAAPKRETPPAKKPKVEPATTAAPVIYAAPPTKNSADKAFENASFTNGQIETSVIVSSPASQQMDEPKTVKTIEEPMATTVTVTTTTIVNPSGTTTSNDVVSKKEKKKKKIIRMAGGQAWEDNSLMDWDSDDFRIFCGDLGNDVTDEVLIRAFSKYQSFVKAKVIRDKRTNKTKGYGFVSFKDPQDFIKAMREMNGRYVGSRPIKLRKSTWRDRNIEIVRKKQKEKEKLGLL